MILFFNLRQQLDQGVQDIYQHSSPRGLSDKKLGNFQNRTPIISQVSLIVAYSSVNVLKY